MASLARIVKFRKHSWGLIIESPRAVVRVYTGTHRRSADTILAKLRGEGLAYGVWFSKRTNYKVNIDIEISS